MDASLAAAAAGAGVVLGWLSGSLADRVAGPRYGVESDDHDPEDLALAPLDPPTTPGQRLALAALGGAGALALAVSLEDGWRVAYFGTLLFLYLAAMVVDLQYLRLPNVFTYAAAVLAAGGALALAAHEGVTAVGTWVGMVGFAGFLWVGRAAFLLLQGREGMGMGDVKLALSLGASAGWLGSIGFDPPWAGGLRLAWYAAGLGIVLGAAVGLLVLRRPSREIPFGPSLVAGWLVVVVLFEPLKG